MTKFFNNSKITYFGAILDTLPKFENKKKKFFQQKGSVTFKILLLPNIMKKIGKN